MLLCGEAFGDWFRLNDGGGGGGEAEVGQMGPQSRVKDKAIETT